jgi:hypothetical protein
VDVDSEWLVAGRGTAEKGTDLLERRARTKLSLPFSGSRNWGQKNLKAGPMLFCGGEKIAREDGKAWYNSACHRDLSYTAPFDRSEPY